MRKRSLALAISLFALSFATYYRTLQPSVGDFGDSAKFQLAAYTLSVPHATGYPLYIALAKLFTLLPIRDVAFRVNLFSALSAALAVAFLGAVIRRKTGSLVAAGTAALLFAWSPTFWSQAVIAEVYALHAALMALLLLFLFRWQERGERSLYAGFLAVYALGLGNHASMVLLAPALLWLVGTTDRRMLTQPRNLALAAGILALGASQYGLLYLRARQHPPFCEYCPDTPAKLRWYLSGAQFRSHFFAFSWQEVGKRVAGYVHLLWAEYGSLPLGAGLLGVLSSARTGWRRQIFLLLAFLSTVLFATSYDVPDYANFLIPSYLIFALWIGDGFAALIRRMAWLARQVGGSRLYVRLPGGWTNLGRGALVLAMLGLAVRPLYANYAVVDESRNNSAREEATTLLDMLEEEALLVLPPCCDFYNQAMGIRYLQLVEGVRPDVAVYTLPYVRKEPGRVVRPSFTPQGKPERMVLQAEGGRLRPAYLPWLSAPRRAVVEEEFLLRPVDSSQVPIADLLAAVPTGAIVVLVARQPLPFPLADAQTQGAVAAALRRLGFDGVVWRGWGAHVLIGVEGAEPGTALSRWDPQRVEVRLRPGDPIGSTGTVAPVALRLISAGDDADIIVNGTNVSPHHWGYNLAILDPRSGDLVETAYFDVTSFRVNNVRVYRIAAVRDGERIVRMDPTVWRPPREQLDFRDPAVTWFLEEGWSAPEPWGTWATGRESRLQVSLPPGPPYRLTMEVVPYCPTPNARQTIRVLWNGTPLQDLAFEGCRSQTFSLSLPAGLVSGDVDQLTFRYGYAISPFEASGGSDGDRRQLAVGFTRLRFEPLAEEDR